MSISADQSRSLSSGLSGGLSKVAEVTVLFWIIKVLTTGMGETTADWFMAQMSPKRALALFALVLAATLAVQFAKGRYVPWVYWLAMVMVSIFGTLAADVIHFTFGVSLIASTLGFAAALAAIFALWHRLEGTLAITSIRNRRREAFYWLAVMTTFALGTAAGDLTANRMGLGWFGSGILFAVLIALPAIAWWKFDMAAVPAFWVAYILTRPLGASFADWMAMPEKRGGLDWGLAQVSVVLGIVIAALVAYLTVTRKAAP